MLKYSFYCKACDESYDVNLTTQERETKRISCPFCGDAEKQEVFAVGSDGAKAEGGGHCGGCSGHGGCR